MFARRLLLGLICGLSVALIGAPAPAADPIDPATIKKLVSQLGSDVFAEREQATRELDRIGMPALEELRKATKDDDIEMKRRATDLVGRIEKRFESSTLLTASKVNLDLKDVLVSKAVAELAKQSGYKIALLDPNGALKDKTVTLKTGDVSFWEAFDQLCDNAGLTEANITKSAGPTLQPRPILRAVPAAPAVLPVAPAKAGSDLPDPVENKTKPPKERRQDKPAKADKPAPPLVAPAILPRGVIILDEVEIVLAFDDGPAPRNVGGPTQQTNQIVLVPGKPDKLATDYSSAIRVRALAKADQTPKPNDRVLVLLQVSPEPKLTWQKLEMVKINKAIDDNDQSLEPSTDAVANAVDAAAPVPVPAAGAAVPLVIRRGALPMTNRGVTSPNQTIPVYLKRGDKESKSLKEFTGVISARILGPAKAMITVNDILNASGKVIKGVNGGSIKVLDVTKDEGRPIRINIELDLPPDVVAAPIGSVLKEPLGLPMRAAPAIAPKAAPAKPGAGLAFEGKTADVPAPPPPVALPAGVTVVASVSSSVGNASNNGLTIEDAKGNVLPVNVGMQYQMTNGIAKTTYYLTLPMTKDSTEPSKLIFAGSKSVAVDIPFKLKDVALPK